MEQIKRESSERTELVADACGVAEAITGMAERLYERVSQLRKGELILAGIPSRGVEVARRLGSGLVALGGAEPTLGVVDVSMHRDDLAMRSRLTTVEETELPLDLEGRPLVLVDDVLFTGRTIRAAMDAVASFGRPGRIWLAVLIDRVGHRELPIQPDFVGRSLQTEVGERIRVRFESLDGVADSVRVVTSGEG